MSENALDAPTTPAAPPKKSIAVKILRIFIPICLIIICAQIIFYFLISPKLQVQNIIITGAVEIEKELIVAAAGLHTRVFYGDVDVNHIRENILSLTQVRDAVVKKRFPNTVSIAISERIAVLVCITPHETIAQSVALIDQSGFIYAYQSADSRNELLPILSGFTFTEFTIGVQLPRALQSFMESLAQLKTDSVELYQQLSEVQIHAVGDDEFQIVLYFYPIPFPVYIYRTIDKQKIQQVYAINELLKNDTIANQPLALDFRSNFPILKYEEIL